MGRPAIDMTNQQVGKLKILKRDYSKEHGAWWIYQCECGTIKSIRGTDLRTGRVFSCGCYNKEINHEVHVKDLLNQTFGKLTVVQNTSKSTPDRYRIWLCKCECGNLIELPSDKLLSGNTQSCGCLKSKGELKISKLLQQANIKYEKEKIFINCHFKDGGVPRFDFYIPELNYCIEYDGVQHFKSGTGWNTKDHLKITQERDNFKNEWCKNNNISLIRIPYWHLDNLSINDLLLESSKFLFKG